MPALHVNATAHRARFQARAESNLIAMSETYIQAYDALSDHCFYCPLCSIEKQLRKDCTPGAELFDVAYTAYCKLLSARAFVKQFTHKEALCHSSGGF